QRKLAVRNGLGLLPELRIEAVDARKLRLDLAAQLRLAIARLAVEPLPREADLLAAKVVWRVQGVGKARRQTDRAEHAPIAAQFVAADGRDHLFQPVRQRLEQ